MKLVYSAMKPGYMTTTLRPNNKLCSGSCQFSKPSEVQDAGISWQDNVHCFLGCWRYTADWLDAAQGDNYRGHSADLLCKLLITSKEKHQGKLTQVPVVLHDNAPVHSHILDRLLYLNGFWKKCATHHILMTWHPVIIVCNPNLKKHFHRQRFSTPVCYWRAQSTVRTILFY